MEDTDLRALNGSRGLAVYQIKERCRVLGPGTRAVVWFHGCALDCPGCIAREMNRSDEFFLVTPSDLAARLTRISGIEGVTLTGGDPFDQPRTALLELLTHIRERSRLSIVCYTGRSLEQLVCGGEAGLNRAILGRIDMLIDGPYRDDLNQGHLWRGSSNQRIWFLTPRYRHLKRELAHAMGRDLEFELSLDGRLSIAGIPAKGFMEAFAARLNSRGVELKGVPSPSQGEGQGEGRARTIRENLPLTPALSPQGRGGREASHL